MFFKIIFIAWLLYKNGFNVVISPSHKVSIRSIYNNWIYEISLETFKEYGFKVVYNFTKDVIKKRKRTFNKGNCENIEVNYKYNI